MSSSKKIGRDADGTDRVDLTTLKKLREESQRGPLPTLETREREVPPEVEFAVSTDSVDEDLLKQLRQHSHRSSGQVSPSPLDHTLGAPPRVEFPEQPVIEALEEWTSASSGDFAVEVDLEDLPERTPLSPPGKSASKLPALDFPEPELYPVVAIDFGTSYSSVAVLKDEAPVLLPRPVGSIPSMVGVREDGFTVVGDEARQMRVADPTNVLASPKRLLGRRYDDREVEPYLADLGMATSEGQGGEIWLHAREQIYTVDQICATVIYRLRQYAQEYVGGEVTEAVFTVPVSYGPERVRALTRAAAIAGLKVLKVIEEPAAAALAYRETADLRGLIAVYDFGGGTFDFSVLDVDQGLTVMTTAGDTWLGGDDFDEALAGAVANAFWRQSKIELRHNAVQWQRLLYAAELTKRALSTSFEANLSLDQVANTREGSLNLDVTITRPQFAVLVRQLIERSLDTCEMALELSDIDRNEIGAVFMSGGSSLVPAVLDGVSRFFGKIPLISVPPDKAVILGAASYVGMLRKEREAGASA
jgi:molecular chaperone DnaK